VTRSARLLACAKLNLDLRVLHKRPDGYHELRTVFQTISLADRLTVEFTPGRRTLVTAESSVDIPDNLVTRAAGLVLDAAKVRGHAHFQLEKRIPMGSGLGGGSSDAAAVLLALPVLIGRSLPMETLQELAAKLGSDVPFFLEGGTAVGLGRGEELYPLPPARLGPMLVVAPRLHVSTPEAYKALSRGLTFSGLSHTIDSFRSFVWGLDGGLSKGGTCDGGANDFEAPVFKLHPRLKALKGKLLKVGAQPARLTGSGSALFGVFGCKADRDEALRSFQDEPAFAVSAISRQQYRSLWWRQLRAHISGRVWPPQSRYDR